MQAMVLNKINGELTWSTLAVPTPLAGQVLIRVMACGICRTDLHIIDGELTLPKLPLIPGHEVIGTVVSAGDKTSGLHEGDVVGVPWLGYACGKCRYCLRGQENLCNRAIFTGYTMNGGFAQYAPFLCAGLIGYRSYRFIPAEFSKIGLYGFGAAAHIIAQLAVMQGKKIYAFTRKGDDAAGKFALSLGAAWAGGSDESSPEKLDAAIIFAPAGELIPKALGDCDRGGIVVCGGIHMSDIPSFPYSILWEERQVRSVANLTRKDAEEFMAAAAVHTPHTSVELFPLEQANSAIRKFREGKIRGAAVLVMTPGNVRLT